MPDTPRPGDQPLPTPNAHPDIQSQVIADIEARRQVGIKRYGTALQPHNGRDMLLDAYEEAMDLTIYLKGCLVERETLQTASVCGAWGGCILPAGHNQGNVDIPENHFTASDYMAAPVVPTEPKPVKHDCPAPTPQPERKFAEGGFIAGIGQHASTQRLVDGRWVEAEPMGWQEEHDWISRLIFWVRRIPHCNDEAQRRLVARERNDSLGRFIREERARVNARLKAQQDHPARRSTRR